MRARPVHEKAGGRKVQAVKRQSRTKGAAGEDRAAAWLRSCGWTIRERNFRTRRGEIDIIAEKGPDVVFFEVKAWESLPQSELEYSLSARKQGRIAQAARFYLAQNSDLAGRPLRFDVIFIDAGTDRIRHIEGAFPGGID
jgi:putative endonuclease